MFNAAFLFSSRFVPPEIVWIDHVTRFAVTMSTTGDKILDTALSKVTNKIIVLFPFLLVVRKTGECFLHGWNRNGDNLAFQLEGFCVCTSVYFLLSFRLEKRASSQRNWRRLCTTNLCPSSYIP